MHEAFAETLPLNPEPGILVPKAPPEAIQEVPPDQAPADGNYVWIPGYWGWSDDRQDFIWISGVWRQPPPGAQWVPGYWSQTDQGYQWIAGYWWYSDNAAQQQQVNYLPQPPASLENGPSAPAPSDDYFWIPGCWIWRDTQYAWQAGYWARGVPNWVWVASHYMWAPSGCVFIAGHWDYPLANRGVLFAPVYFPAVVYSQPQFRYVPTVVINVNVIETSLFLRPRYCHYYFGDYYGPMYSQIGIYPWFTAYTERRGYDPLFTYAYWSHRGHDQQWLGGLQEEYQYRVAHDDARPPHTFHDFDRWEREHHEGGRTFRLAAPLADVSRIEKLPFRLERITPQQRDEFGQRRQQLHQFVQQRQQMERDLHQQMQQQGAENRRPLQRSLPQSPIAHRDFQGGAGQQPPGLTQGHPGTPQGATGGEAGRLTERTAPPQQGEQRGEAATRRPEDLSRTGQPGQPGQPGQQPFGPQQERRAGRQPLEQEQGPQGQQRFSPQPGNQPGNQPGRQPGEGSRFNQPGAQPLSPGQQPGQRFDQGQRSDQSRRPNEGQRFERGPGQREAPGQFPGSRQSFQSGQGGPQGDRGRAGQIGPGSGSDRSGAADGRAAGRDGGRDGGGGGARGGERSSSGEKDK